MGCAPGDTRAPERRWSGCEVRDGGARRLVYTGITLALAVAALVFAGTHQIGVMAQRAGTWYGIAMRPGRVYAITGTPRWQGAAAARVSLPAGPAGVASDRSGDMSIGFLDHGPVFVPARTGTYFGVPMRAGHMYLIPGARTRLGLGTGEVAADRSGNVLVADQARNLVLVAPARPGRFYGRQMAVGRMYPVAGDGKAAASGNGGPALAAGFSPFQVTADRRATSSSATTPGTTPSAAMRSRWWRRTADVSSGCR